MAWKQEHIKLNVGGCIYHTSRQTLLSVPDTIFAEAFHGNIEELKSESDGSIFIDRSGELFRYVLEFLRNPNEPIPASVRTPEFLREA